MQKSYDYESLKDELNNFFQPEINYRQKINKYNTLIQRVTQQEGLHPAIFCYNSLDAMNHPVFLKWYITFMLSVHQNLLDRVFKWTYDEGRCVYKGD